MQLWLGNIIAQWKSRGMLSIKWKEAGALNTTVSQSCSLREYQQVTATSTLGRT